MQHEVFGCHLGMLLAFDVKCKRLMSEASLSESVGTSGCEASILASAFLHATIETVRCGSPISINARRVGNSSGIIFARKIFIARIKSRDADFYISVSSSAWIKSRIFIFTILEPSARVYLGDEIDSDFFFRKVTCRSTFPLSFLDSRCGLQKCHTREKIGANL